MSQSQDAHGSLARDVAWGMLAGLVGTIALDRTTTLLYERESDEAKQREKQAGGTSPYEVVADKILKTVGPSLGIEPSEQARRLLGQAIHWEYGMMWGGVFGALHHRVPALTRAGGLPFALAFWLIADEIIPVAMGASAPPQKYPLETHLRGLAGHLAYTAAAEATFQGLQSLARVAGEKPRIGARSPERSRVACMTL